MSTKRTLTGADARRERGRKEMRASIVESAGQIVARDGSDGLTIRAVAQDLGYSPGALYEYFDSKEMILCALYFEGTDGLGAHCEHAVANLPHDAAAIDRLAALGRAYRLFALAHAELYRLTFCGFDSPPNPPSIDDPAKNSGGFGVTVRVVTEGIADGSFIDMPPVVMATAAWASVHGFVSLEIGGHIDGSDGPGMSIPPPEEARKRRDISFDALLQMALHGIVREERRPTITS